MGRQTQVYDPLPDDYIRFVEILSDVVDAPLRCKIFTASLNEEPLVPFEALSYVWGEQEAFIRIIVWPRRATLTTDRT